MLEINLPQKCKLTMKDDLYQVKGPGVNLVSASLLSILSLYLEKTALCQNSTEIDQYIHHLETNRMHFLGRMTEIMNQLPREAREEFIEELEEAMNNEQL